MVSQKTLEKWNKEFNSLSDAEKRVAIAKDVLAQIKKKVILPETGTYLYLDNFQEFDRESQANKHIKEIQCNCCALGSMFLSNIKFNNHCTIGQLRSFVDDRIAKDGLDQYFDISQLCLIETAFERWEFNHEYFYDDDDNQILQVSKGLFFGFKLDDLGLTENDLEEAGRLYEDIDDDTERLTLIMKNLIENKGEFKLEL
jgi:hypothetical protein